MVFQEVCFLFKNCLELLLIFVCFKLKKIILKNLQILKFKTMNNIYSKNFIPKKQDKNLQIFLNNEPPPCQFERKEKMNMWACKRCRKNENSKFSWDWSSDGKEQRVLKIHGNVCRDDKRTAFRSHLHRTNPNRSRPFHFYCSCCTPTCSSVFSTRTGRGFPTQNPLQFFFLYFHSCTGFGVGFLVEEQRVWRLWWWLSQRALKFRN